MATSRPIQRRDDPRKVTGKAQPSQGTPSSKGKPVSQGKPTTQAKPAAARKSGRPGGKPGAPVRPATVGDWIDGARLRTLPLAIVPVALGSAAAYLVSNPGWHWVRILLCLAVALFLQIGVNFANDYSDGIRGTDRYRVGPSRLTGSGAARPRTVLTVALVFFGLAAVTGLVLVILSGTYWMLAVGAVCIVAAYFYTGGKHPYGYYGLGEVFVFVFFGLVATAGTTFVQVQTVNIESWLAGIAAGSLACAVLMVNNIRDIQADRAAGKRTLAVLIGPIASRVVFCILLLLPFAILAILALFYSIAWLGFFALLLAVPACIITITAKTSKELILALQLTSFTGLAFAIALGSAFVF
ncbi:MAG: 1,4-dihydroxy-2-naphthoate polyprenyltransferase [Microbacteriaceae bacterium]|nr:1,4-dihydroxy-2-naphthoate polyprenyltransferase [Microbacteriaceae bacterium]